MITDAQGHILYGAYMHEISHQMHIIMDEKLSIYGITHQQNRMLLYLSDFDGKRGVYQNEFESIFKLRRSSITSLLSNLEKKGLIERFSHVGDSRVKQVVLTETGRNLVAQTKDVIKNIEQQLVKTLTTEQKKVLVGMLDIMVENINA